MNLQALRAREKEHRRERALVDMRDQVAATIAARHPDAGDAVVDAVGEAILQLVTDGGYLADPEEVRRRLFVRATRRLIDEGRCGEARYRDPVAVEEHTQALLRSFSGDLLELIEEARL